MWLTQKTIKTGETEAQKQPSHGKSAHKKYVQQTISKTEPRPHPALTGSPLHLLLPRQLQAVRAAVLVRGAGAPNAAGKRLHRLNRTRLTSQHAACWVVLCQIVSYTLQRENLAKRLYFAHQCFRNFKEK